MRPAVEIGARRVKVELVRRFLPLILAALASTPDRARAAELEPCAAEAVYEFKANHDPDGIGKFYLGREIAHVMGHEGADWLEREERDREERPDLLLDALQLKAGMSVADVGAGTGYHSRRMARLAGPTGKVFAVDIQKEMLEIIDAKSRKESIGNIQTILGDTKNPRLPRASIDLVLMVDVYHELEYPCEMVAAIREALKPGGRLVLVEFRAEDPAVPIKPLHKMTATQARKEMAHHSFRWVENSARLPWQHLLVFEKAAEPLPVPKAK